MNKNQLAAAAAMLLGIFGVIYFVELASFPFSIDEELSTFRTDATTFIGLGRWGVFLIESSLLRQPILPFFPQLLFGLGCVVSYLLILQATGRLENGIRLADLAAFAIFCGFPTWFFLVEFYTNIPQTGIGLASATFAIWLASQITSLHDRRRWIFVPAVFCAAFAIGIYQSFVLYTVALGLGLTVIRLFQGDRKNVLGRFVSVCVLAIVAVITYGAIDQAFKWYWNTGSHYVGIFFDPASFVANPLQALRKTFAEMRGAYGFSQRVFRHAFWAAPILIGLGFISLAAASWHWRLKDRLIAGALLLATLLLPFSLNLLYSGYLPVRTLVAAPFAIWLCCFLGLQSGSMYLRRVTALVTAIAVYQLMVIQNSNQALNYFVAKHDLAVATSIYDRMGISPNFVHGTTYPMATFGWRSFQNSYPRPFTSTEGASFFEWDDGNPDRISSYMNAIGLLGTRPATAAEADRVIGHLSTMPVWPANGSVLVEDGILLVRLGEQPSLANQAALDRTKTNQLSP